MSADLKIGGPTTRAWREEALARAEVLCFLARTCGGPDAVAAVRPHAEAAREVAVESALDRLRHSHRWRAAPFERALTNLDNAEVSLLRTAPPRLLDGALPSIQAHVNRYMAKDDPRRVVLDDLVSKSDEGRRELLLNALSAANMQRRRNLIRVRSFHTMLRVGTLGAVVIAVGIGFLGYLNPRAIPLCFTPEVGDTVMVACPQATKTTSVAAGDAFSDDVVLAHVRGGDIALVELMGLLGAALSAVVLLRNLRKGTALPYNIPLWLAILKLPSGALTAVAGLLLMRADFVPGLSALDTAAQILGWAIVFGIAQHLVTRLADSHADNLMENVGGRGAGGDRPLKEQDT